jgi:hypothetical protein
MQNKKHQPRRGAGRNSTKAQKAAHIVLLALASLGHATASTLWPLAYPEQAPESARTSTHRLMHKLQQQGLVLRRRDLAGKTRYVLTNSGALATRESWAQAGYDLSMRGASRFDALHRMLIASCNLGEIPRGKAMLRAGAVPGADRTADGAIQSETGEVLNLRARDVLHALGMPSSSIQRDRRRRYRHDPCADLAPTIESKL